MSGDIRLSTEASSFVNSVTLEAVVTRADGTTEDLGVIARWDKNPVKRLLHKIMRRS
jgi:hypothetical protein